MARKALQWILKQEAWLFLLFSLLNVYTIFQIGFYFSLDGPQHLYVANIIAELWKGNDYISQYILINDLPVGYWTGTFILAVSRLFFSPEVSVKILLLIYYFGIAYSFRYLVRSVNKNPGFLHFLIFPFSATFFIGSGYYNFSMAIPVLFLCLGYFIRHHGRFNWRSGAIMAFLLLLQFFTHAFVYAITGLVILLYQVFVIFRAYRNIRSVKTTLAFSLRSLGRLFLIALPANAFMVNYVVSIREITSYIQPAHEEAGRLIDNILNLRPLAWFVIDQHQTPNLILWGIIAALGIVAIVRLFPGFRRPGKEDPAGPSMFNKLVFLTMSIIILLVYFLYPDKFMTGNLSMRILTLFFMMLISWLAIQRLPGWISLLILPLIIFSSWQKWEIRMEIIPKLASGAIQISRACENLEKDASFVTIDYSTLWTQVHYGNMPAIVNPMLKLNAPQVQGQFPLRINYAECPRFYLGDINMFKAKLNWSLVGNENIPVQAVDYIILIYPEQRDESPQHRIILDVIDQYYKRVDSGERRIIEIYQLRNGERIRADYMEAIRNAREEMQEKKLSPRVYYASKYLDVMKEYRSGSHP